MPANRGLWITTPDGTTRPAIADDHGSHAAMPKTTQTFTVEPDVQKNTVGLDTLFGYWINNAEGGRVGQTFANCAYDDDAARANAELFAKALSGNTGTPTELHACIHITGVDGMRALLVKARDEIVSTGNTDCRGEDCDCALCDLQAAIDHIDALDGEGLRRLSAAAADVLEERRRQIKQEGWTPQHDDQHASGELSQGAADYAANASFTLSHGEHLRGSTATEGEPSINWPWASEWWKPKTVRRDLVRAGALILAELERLDRLAGEQAPEGDTDVATLSDDSLRDLAADERNAPRCSQCGAPGGEHWDTGCEAAST